MQLCKHATHGLNKAFSLTLSPLWEVYKICSHLFLLRSYCSNIISLQMQRPFHLLWCFTGPSSTFLKIPLPLLTFHASKFVLIFYIARILWQSIKGHCSLTTLFPPILLALAIALTMHIKELGNYHLIHCFHSFFEHTLSY